jgi:tetratricopeptide (TPR) repeat protein
MNESFDQPGSKRGGRYPGKATLAALLGALLVVQSAYLAISNSPSLFYVANVFAHVIGGLVLTPLFIVAGVRGIRAARKESGATAFWGNVALFAFGASIVAALVLIAVHNTRPTRWILYVHISLAVLAVLAALTAALLYARRTRNMAPFRWLGAASAAGIGVLLLGSVMERVAPNPRDRIENPERPPFEMAGEAMGGAEGPFFPSSVATSTGGRIPSNFFMTSETCARCHKDIYEAWKGSAHHFSSFNNQWYRKSIEYMQAVNSVQSSKWCAGCHDHAVILNGMMDRPISEFIHTQEAHTGLACNSCHAITNVGSTMGQGDFYLDYPPLHDLAVSENPLLRWMHDFAVQLDPGPHKQVFLKPYHREQTAEFCASCHKVHLDVPVNNYRWIRGFNEYDNWQASGVSGMGARSFYYPAKPMDCADCHMPRIESDDKGNIDGFVHDHSFLAANTALPAANLHEDQLRRTIEFLQKNQVTVDIFAASPARPLENKPAVSDDTPTLASTFAVGEEAAMAVGAAGGPARELAPVWAPLDRADIAVRRGEEVRIDVVVRTRTVGHFFPGGTVDAHGVWLELRGKDENGRVVFWSGVAQEGGSGPVDTGAQFYRSHPIDAHGNVIDKRNAWAARAVAWVNLIPPGAADVAHYRLLVPEDCGDTIHLEARLNYRKFTFENTVFSFAGAPAPGEPEGPGPGIDRVTKHYDDRKFVIGEVPEDVSAEVREIPNLPIVVMHKAEAKLRVVPRDAKVENVCPPVKADEWMRWNDYGIGLFRQDDLQGAKRAFENVVSADGENPEGYVNLGRVFVREGLIDDAEEILGKALAINNDLAKTHYFLGVVNKERGKYDEALVHLRKAESLYPKDRVVLNDIGRVLFLQRKFEEAIVALKKVIEIDPEDLMAHYNMMLCCKGLGRLEDAEAEKRLYERFKADEDANILLGPYLRENPHDNRMRQLIHEQVSVPREVIDREVAIRVQNGEPNVVLPGEAAEFAKRVVQRGQEMIKAGHKASRYLGPVEADAVRPIDLDLTKKSGASRKDQVVMTESKEGSGK